MPLSKLTTSYFSRTSPATRLVNQAIDEFNGQPTRTNLDKVQAAIDMPGRAVWGAQFAEIAVLESTIRTMRMTLEVAVSGGAAALGASLVRDTSPTRWVETILPDAPSLAGVETEGSGKKGAQGSTHQLRGRDGRKLFAKTARSKDKDSEKTETRREFEVYDRVYKSAGTHRNLVKVYGWATIRIGDAHQEGFIMDHIDGPDGRTLQSRLKEAWDLGVINSAEYWSSVQYIGRCHIEVLRHLIAAGWAHNDIKPENYVVDSATGEVIVIDLGGAGEQGGQWHAVTIEYTAPEMRTGRYVDHRAVGTAQADIFSVGATLAHAVEAPHAFHGIAKPNRPLGNASPSTQALVARPGVELGRYKNPFQYGVETDYTRQMQRMMSANIEERNKVLDERASNKFLYDSILNDEQARQVLKGIASGASKMAWEIKWKARQSAGGLAGPAPTMRMDSITLESRLADLLRPYQGGMGGIEIPDNMVFEDVVRQEQDLAEKKREIEEMERLINQSAAFGVDTSSARLRMNELRLKWRTAEAKLGAAKARFHLGESRTRHGALAERRPPLGPPFPPR